MTTQNLPKTFETERGSIYHYLPDGRNQRRKYTGEIRPAHDVTVFLPDYETLIRAVPRELLTKSRLDVTAEDYDDALTSKVYCEGYEFSVIDKKGKVLNNPEELADAEGLFLVFQRGSQVDFYLPVSRIPKIGWSVFQVTGRGPGKRTHLGHKVSKID